MCEFCSAQIPQATARRKNVAIAPAVWAEGLNRRARHTVLAGGEPFLYDGFTDLVAMLEPTYKVEIYTNLQHSVEAFIAAARRPFQFLISLHSAADADAWRARVARLDAAGHSLRFHVVRSGEYKKLAEFLVETELAKYYRTSLQGDQRAGPKSAGPAANKAHPVVDCTSRICLFGPDGARYHCVHKLVTGDANACFGHISRPDESLESQMKCTEFGLCAGCDNNIEGIVTDDNVA
jgi:hypothetical protein